MICWLGGGRQNSWVPRAIEAGGTDGWLAAFSDIINYKEAPLMLTPEDFRFFLDSGAYSAWSRGTVIDLDEYIEFIKANIEMLDAYASLDVIPGKPGAIATQIERDAAAQQSWRNYLYMVEDGLQPIPVYHYGEHERFLDRMLQHGCDYIGIGGLVGVPGPLRLQWLDRVFDRLTDAEGMPIVKTHGFGMTAIPLIFRYPWHSVDSTTWIKITANGAVYLPAMQNGRFVFDEIPTIISVSDKNDKQTEGGKHANSLSPGMKRILVQWLESCGKSLAQVTESYFHRATVNVTFFRKVSELKATRPFEKAALRRGRLL